MGGHAMSLAHAEQVEPSKNESLLWDMKRPNKADMRFQDPEIHIRSSAMSTGSLGQPASFRCQSGEGNPTP